MTGAKDFTQRLGPLAALRHINSSMSLAEVIFHGRERESALEREGNIVKPLIANNLSAQIFRASTGGRVSLLFAGDSVT